MQYAKSFEVKEGQFTIQSDESLAVTRTALMAKTPAELNILFEQLFNIAPPTRNEGRESKVNRILAYATRASLAQPQVAAEPAPPQAPSAPAAPPPQAPAATVSEAIPAPAVPADVAPATEAITEESEDMAARKKAATPAKAKKAKAAPEELTAKQKASLRKVPRDGEFRTSHQLEVSNAHLDKFVSLKLLKRRELKYGTEGRTKTQYAWAG